MKTINVKELRLGNLLFFDGTIASIDSIQGDGTLRFCEMSGSFYSTRNGIQPIPLSEEFLLKFKFIPLGGATGPKEYRLKDSPFSVYSEETGGNGGHTFYFKCSQDRITPISSMHQLRNLYFALTGLELDNSLSKRKN